VVDASLVIKGTQAATVSDVPHLYNFPPFFNFNKSKGKSAPLIALM